MKNLALAMIALAIALAPAFAEAQRFPNPVPSPACGCDFCYENPHVTCYAPEGNGPCSFYLGLFCYPWWGPGENLAPTSWRSLDLGDALMAQRALEAEAHDHAAKNQATGASHDHAAEALEADAADRPMPSFGADV